VKKSDVDSARTLGIVGIVVGALGLLLAGAALATRRKAT
jgi:MYXO-CTERM domain-containing protein